MTRRRTTSSRGIGSQRNTKFTKDAGCSTPGTGSRARSREAGDSRQIRRAATAGGPTAGASWGRLPNLGEAADRQDPDK